MIEKENIQAKIDNLEKVFNKYHETFKDPFKYAGRINAIESEIEVLKEVLNGDLKADKWEKCFKEDLRDFKA